MADNTTVSTFSLSRLVQAPRLRLFDFLIDFRNETKFGHAVRSCRVETPVAPGPRARIDEGTVFAFDYSFFGLRLSTIFRVEQVVDGERFLLRQLRGGIPFSMQYVFIDEGEGCRVTTHTRLPCRGWARWGWLALAWLAERSMTKYMDLMAEYGSRELGSLARR